MTVNEEKHWGIPNQMVKQQALNWGEITNMQIFMIELIFGAFFQ